MKNKPGISNHNLKVICSDSTLHLDILNYNDQYNTKYLSCVDQVIVLSKGSLTYLNLGFSSVFLREVLSCLVKVEASHSLTSCGTASGSTSDNSSSSSPTWRLLWRRHTRLVTNSSIPSLPSTDLILCCSRFVVVVVSSSELPSACSLQKLAINVTVFPRARLKLYRIS